MSHFYTPCKRQKSKGFLTFSRGIEIRHFREKGLLSLVSLISILTWNYVLKTNLTYFIALVSFYTPWKYKETRSFLMVSGGIKRDRPVSWNGLRNYRFNCIAQDLYGSSVLWQWSPSVCACWSCHDAFCWC